MNPHPAHYPQPPGYGMPPQPPKASGLAIASMVLGIIGCGVTGMVAVVLYSLDGEAPEDEASTEDTTKAYEAFRAAKAGLANAKNALEFVRARMPEVDATRIYAAGHSSAGNHQVHQCGESPGRLG